MYIVVLHVYHAKSLQQPVSPIRKRRECVIRSVRILCNQFKDIHSHVQTCSNCTRATPITAYIQIKIFSFHVVFKSCDAL